MLILLVGSVVWRLAFGLYIRTGTGPRLPRGWLRPLLYQAERGNNMTLIIQFACLLVLLFVALKHTGHILWSWWAVTSPLWGSATVLAVFIAGAFVGVNL